MKTPWIAARPLLAVLVVAAGSSPARAQAPAASPSPEPSPAPPRLTETVDVEAELPALPPANLTTTRMPLAVLDTPAAVSVVPRALFEAQDAFFLGDALENAAGVAVHTGFGVFDFFTIRGFDSLSSGLVLTDGVAEPESPAFALYNVRQVEVLKGPAAFLYGANPLSGAVHLVRKQPTAGRNAEVSLSYGRFGTFEATLDGNAATADGRLAARLNAVVRDSDGFRDGRTQQVVAVNPTLLWRPTGRTRVTAGFEMVANDFVPDSGIPVVGGRIADVPRTQSYQSPFDVSDQDVHRGRLEIEHRLNDRVLLRDRAYVTRLRWDSNGTLLAGVFPSPFGEVVGRAITLLDDEQTLVGNQLEAVLSLGTGAARHQILAGFEISRLRDDFTLDVGQLPVITLQDPFETATGGPALIPQLRQQGEARATVFAPYVLDHVTVGRVHLFAGARLDMLDYEEPVSGTRREDTRVSPLLGISVSPAERLSVYVSAGTAFAPPSTLVVGEREPERSRQVEIGIKRELMGGKVFVSAAAYHLEKEDIAIPDATGVTRQTGDQRSRGMELELSAEPVDGWYTAVSYAWNDAELTHFTERVALGQDPSQFAVLDHSGNVPAFAPRHLANAWSVRRFGPWSVGLGARYVGGQFIAEDNAFALDDDLTFDAMAGWRHGRVSVAVNARNLTDKEYATRGFGNVSVIPAEPFTLAATVRIGVGRR